MSPASTQTVYLRKGLKFRALVGKLRSKGKSKGGRLQYKTFIGPCAVEMTKAQVLSFKDLLQTTPSVLADAPVEKTETETEGAEPDDIEDDTGDEDSDAAIELTQAE